MVKKASQKGFTLVELAVIMVLVGIVIFVVTKDPSKQIQVDSQAERLVSDLRFMQHLAMSENERTRVNFSSGQYTLTELNGSTGIDHPSLNINVVAMPSGVTLSDDLPSGYVVFDGLGQPYVDNGSPGTALGSTATITFTSGSDVETVTIAPETGRINKP